MTVQIRTIVPEDQQAVRDLHWNHYWRSHCLLLNQDFYDWQFSGSPENVRSGGDQSVVAVDGDGQLLSYLGVVPMSTLYRGTQLRSAHLITWLTDPSARGQGIGFKVMDFATKKYDFLFGRSVTPAALSIYQKFGFRYFRNCERWIAILDADAATALAVDRTELSAKRIRARTVRIDPSVTFEVSDKTPLGIGALSTSVLDNGVSFGRSFDFFVWRYQQHPIHSYKFLYIGNPEAPDGIAVLRLEKVAGRSGVVLRIVEFIAGERCGRTLASAVLAYGKECGCAYADVFGMSEKYVAGFISAGGFDILEEELIHLPHLLQPWDPDVEPPGLLFFGRRDPSSSTGLSPVDDMTRVYVSKGDGNMDWPSWIPSADGESIAPATKLAIAGT